MIRRAVGRVRAASIILVSAAAGACSPSMPDIVPGVSGELAEFRRGIISDVRYHIRLSIPSVRAERVSGSATIRFRAERKAPIILDFDTRAAAVGQVRLGGDSVSFSVGDGHIVIPASETRPGEQEVTVEFAASDGALNRQDEFLYSLFVPDRASTAFPCFDQPDIKARYRLDLVLPDGWTALSNGAVSTRSISDTGSEVSFAETAPISTYLFAFAAGKFMVEEGERGGRIFRMYHRETDAPKVERSRGEIFDLHAAALEWLEAYTGIPYPFGKFEFLAVPAFQFGGMEHPGAIWYRAASLFLDEAPTTNQLLGRASLIAHETAHMWFGNLVTMEWFNDVWMKEVFANFMAAKIVAPSFPALNHDLRFFLAHHPSAYAVDRTDGANPVRQPLDNLRDAGTLYGAIIYQKAPVVMRHLERLVGEETLRTGLRDYLRRFSFGNATWLDLVEILDELSDEDLRGWSKVWVEEAGRPRITATVEEADGSARSLHVRQADTWHGRNVLWNQRLDVVLGFADTARSVHVHLRARELVSDVVANWPEPDYVLPGADGLAYGHFALDSVSRAYLLAHVAEVRDPIVRAAALSALWEGVLYGESRPSDMMTATLELIPHETDELMLQYELSLLESAYWRFLTPEQRAARADRIESQLWALLERARESTAKRAYLDAIVSMTITEHGTRRLRRLWAMEETVPGLPLAEEQYIELAKALAVRDVPDARSILQQQLERIRNVDRRERFTFILPALSARQEERDAFFESLRSLESRRREAWVLEAVAQLHHPLRADSSIRYILPSLELVEEIQRTGDIFFPLRWLNAVLGGHQSAAAADIVTRFLNEHRSYPPRLRAKILQAADQLHRASRIVR